MTTARKNLVDPEVTRYYHCISRCVRQAFLCGKGFEDRKQWIEARLELLAKHFAISVAGFAVMDNHLHVLCWLVWTSDRMENALHESDFNSPYRMSRVCSKAQMHQR